MVQAMGSWVDILTNRFSDYGVAQEVINKMPVCIAGRSESVELPIAKN